MLKTPQFWKKSTLPLWMKPLSWMGPLYAWATAFRLRQAHPKKVGVPVICVGNISLGGVGKTPIVRDLAQKLAKKGVRVGILSRGYGGRLSGPIRVVPSHHTAFDVGDEPLLLAQSAPTWVARDRVAGARVMVKKGIDCILMDDGHQNPHLRKDVSFVVVDAKEMFGNGRVFPVGPLREPVAVGIKRADAIVVVGTPDAADEKKLKAYKKPIFTAQMETDIRGLDLKKPHLAFAGIGRPQKFFDSLTDQGVSLTETLSFPDHHVYTEKEVKDIHKRAEAQNGLPLTTEKDFCRLKKKQKKGILWAPLHIKWKGEKSPVPFVMEKIKNG